MELFENKVGRPSNEIKRKRKFFVGTVSLLIVAVMCIGTYVCVGTYNSTRLKGAAAEPKTCDYNGDGKVTSEDATLVLRASARLEDVTSAHLKKCDFNADGKISAAEARKVLRFAEGIVGDVTGSTGTTAADKNEAMKVAYESSSATNTVIKKLDVNEDKKVDMTDVEELEIKSENGNSNFGKYKPGDVNRDNKVDLDDAILVLRASAKLETLDSTQKQLADLDDDGKIYARDARLIAIQADNEAKENIPYKKGDVNRNGIIDAQDSTMILKASARTLALDEVQMTLADFNEDGIILANDARAVARLAEEQGTFGDINGDGKVTVVDARIVLRASAKLEDLTNEQKKLADIDKDGVIAARDARIILRMTDSEAYGNLMGDVDLDGKVTSKDARLTLRASARLENLGATQKYLADVDGNGKITARDARVIQKMAVNSEEIKGDVNGDGIVTASEARTVLRASARMETLTEEQFKRCDMDNDGKITARDARTILRISSSKMK